MSSSAAALAAACSAGDPNACQNYYAQSYAQAPSVTAAQNSPAPASGSWQVGGNPITALPVTFTDSLQQAVAGPGIGFAAGQCPMCGGGNCAVGGDCTNTIGCAEIRECDPYTGAQHGEYNIGGSNSPNANIWSIDPATGKMVWLGSNGQPTTPPNWATPPVTAPANGSQYAVLSTTNPTVQQNLANANVPGATYNPSSGWTPAAGVMPTQTSPSSPAFTNNTPTKPGTTTTKGTGSKAASAASLPAGAPGTSGVQRPSVVNQSQQPSAILIAAVVVFILLAVKG